jgi:hypothetical protein
LYGSAAQFGGGFPSPPFRLALTVAKKLGIPADRLTPVQIQSGYFAPKVITIMSETPQSQAAPDDESPFAPEPNGKAPAFVPKPDVKSAKSSDPDALYSPQAMAISAQNTPTAGATTKVKLPNRITVDKPSKQAYFRHDPQLYLQTVLIAHEASRAYYYPATEAVREGLSEFVKVVDLYGMVTLLGDFRFWPVTVLDADNDWNDSAREIILTSVDEWVGYRSLEGRYQIRYPQVAHGEPLFPEATLHELLARSFRGTRTIMDLNHKVAKSLLGSK